jgi:phage-related protein
MYAGSKFDEVLTIVGRENEVDAHHVYAAHLNEDEYFVTENIKQFILGGKREKLERFLGVKTRRTDEFIKEVTSSQTADRPGYGNAYRALYTVRFEKAVYVLHAFQKKSPSGIRTAKRDVDSSERLRTAERDHEEYYGKQKR